MENFLLSPLRARKSDNFIESNQKKKQINDTNKRSKEEQER